MIPPKAGHPAWLYLNDQVTSVACIHGALTHPRAGFIHPAGLDFHLHLI
jgi:hypothetical protein